MRYNWTKVKFRSGNRPADFAPRMAAFRVCSWKLFEAAMHPEADALLDAIWASPGDDTPRLVYADWLQEHGYEQYAEFIRLSVRLAGEIQHPTERAKLRLQRYRLGQDIMKHHPLAFPK
jgi:uncharacterized protein (TIGR02996 family)